MMRNHSSLTILSALLTLICLMCGATVKAQAPSDTILNPTMVFSGIPKTYEIAGIRIVGADNYEEKNILSYAGLKVGDRLQIPGSELNDAAKRLWRQGLFSNVQITVDKVAGNKAWLCLNLRQQPRIHELRYHGVKKGEMKDLNDALQLHRGNQITQNIVNRATQIVEKYYAGKGFGNAEVKIDLAEALGAPNEVIVNINVDKNDKVKVHKIYIDGNEVLTDNQVQGAMKKTNEKGKLRNLFKQKKFVESDYQDDLKRIIQKYNEKGYRDAVILSDSVVPFDEKTVDVYISLDEGKKYYINDITWVGNTVYPTETLNEVLGISKGDVYNQTLLDKRTSQDDDAIANYYMDRGYLFFNLVPIEKNVQGDSIDLEMRIMEGPQARINNVIINGNDRLYEKVIRRELRVKPGELFSKTDLMRSAREIATTGHFDPENMDIRPEPNSDDGTVDILFNLTSKSNDQFEFSMGWGQTGVIGKVAIKFTNFSIKNLFYPNSYRGLIPQGEGQQFTISAQTNARYYQSYSVSFLDPWFGGKRPNALSVSAYYSRQTGVNSSYYNNRYMNYGYGYSYGGLYNTGYNDYYNNSYENSYDPNKYLQMLGVNVGFGKRLSWPDDYFTFQADLGYTWYHVKNWAYLLNMQNGTSNSIVLGLTLSRSSIDNPQYTRSGSMFSLGLQLTPPASLFGKKNWKALAEMSDYYSSRDNYNREMADEANRQMYRWVEYWKLKFQSRTYTPLNGQDSKYTLVFMTRADIGLLGSYNSYLRSPYETFYVGGDGMSGSYTYAQETIALRGYDNGQFTPYQLGGGRAYCRYGLELHFPFLLQPSTTIYGLTFLEGGNAWHKVSDFSPFDIKRSAGVGVRIFLPMVGMMGIDWAYGFDKVYGEKGGSHFHFILGQEF